MPYIDGVGDEVVQFAVGLFLLLISVLAWKSTRTNERQTYRVFLMPRDARAEMGGRSIGAPPPGSESGLQDPTAGDGLVHQVGDEEDKPPSEEEDNNEEGEDLQPLNAGGDDEGVAGEEQEQEAIIGAMDASGETGLRRRVVYVGSRAQDVEEEEMGGQERRIATDGAAMAVGISSSSSSSSGPAEAPTAPTEDAGRDVIRIKLKYINDDLKLVEGSLHEQLGDFKRRHFEVELASNKRVRLIFNGHVLQCDTATLASCGMFDNCVVHCLVHKRRPAANGSESGAGGASASSSSGGWAWGDASQQRGSASRQQGVGSNQPREWDLGNVLFCLVSFALGIAWYFRYEYAHLFTVTATVALVGLTALFMLLLLNLYFPDSEIVPMGTGHIVFARRQLDAGHQHPPSL